jgi:hypothetical protein
MIIEVSRTPPHCCDRMLVKHVAPTPGGGNLAEMVSAAEEPRRL